MSTVINFVRGNLFDTRAEALVNTVNCVGVMGKGIAHQFRRAFPEMFKEYARACRQGQVRLGEVMTFRERGKLIVNFPTKQHWRAKSKLADVEAGLRALRQLIEREHIRSIALPPLGCGNGGLAWPDVKAAISRELDTVGDVSVEVYEPVGTFTSSVAEEPRLTLGHYVLAAIAVRVRGGKIALQKAAYFFNVFADERYFRFEHGSFGPYFVGMDAMLQQLTDYRDFAKVSHDNIVDDGLQRALAGVDADRLRAWLPVIERTAEFARRPPHQLEALATVHAIVAAHAPVSDARLVELFLAWSETKTDRFEHSEILAAARTLEDAHLLTRGLYGLALPQDALTTARSNGAHSQRR